MRQKPAGRPSSSEHIIQDIKRKTRKQYSAEEKIRIVLDGLRGEDSIAELCRREGIAQGLYYKWTKDFMEAGKRRLAGDIVRQANTGEVATLRREARELKEVVAEQILELRLLKKSMIGDGDDPEGDTPPPRSLRLSNWSSDRTFRLSRHWDCSVFRVLPSTAGMSAIVLKDTMPWKIERHCLQGFGTVFPMIFGIS